MWEGVFAPDVTLSENNERTGRQVPSRTHGRPWPCEWVARSAGMERVARKVSEGTCLRRYNDCNLCRRSLFAVQTRLCFPVL